MIKLHYSIADVLDECVAQLESGKGSTIAKKRSRLTIPGTKEARPKSAEHRFVPPHVLREVLRSDCSEQADTVASPAGDSSIEDEYSRYWVDLDQ